jgi:hypothetical protein
VERRLAIGGILAWLAVSALGPQHVSAQSGVVVLLGTPDVQARLAGPLAAELAVCSLGLRFDAPPVGDSPDVRLAQGAELARRHSAFATLWFEHDREGVYVQIAAGVDQPRARVPELALTTEDGARSVAIVTASMIAELRDEPLIPPPPRSQGAYDALASPVLPAQPVAQEPRTPALASQTEGAPAFVRLYAGLGAGLMLRAEPVVTEPNYTQYVVLGLDIQGVRLGLFGSTPFLSDGLASEDGGSRYSNGPAILPGLELATRAVVDRLVSVHLGAHGQIGAAQVHVLGPVEGSAGLGVQNEWFLALGAGAHAGIGVSVRHNLDFVIRLDVGFIAREQRAASFLGSLALGLDFH